MEQKHQSQACFHLKWLAVAVPSIFLATSKKADGGYGLGSRVGIYVCPVTTGVVVDCLYVIPFNLLQYYGPLNTIASK